MQEPDRDFGELAERYGWRAARRIWQLSLRATRELKHALAALHVPCKLENRDSVYYALGEPAGRRLRRELRRRKRKRLPGRWLDAAALRRLTGIDGAGAIRTRGNAQVDPYVACTGLLRAAARDGARIFERSAVDRTAADRSGATVWVNGRTIRCANVIVATGYATPFFAPLAGRFRLLNTYVVCTERVGAEARRELGLADVMLWDTSRPYHYARWTADHRLLLGGGDRPRVPERRRARALRLGAAGIRAYFERRYPSLAAVKSDFAWEGLFATRRMGCRISGRIAPTPGISSRWGTEATG